MRLCPPASGAETKEEAWGKGVLHPQALSYFESKISVKQFSEVKMSGQSHNSDLEAQLFINREFSGGKKSKQG